MKKLPNIILCLCVLFISTNFAQKQIEKQTKSKTPISKKVKNFKSAKKKTRITQENEANFVCQLPASVTNVELSRTEIVLNCPAPDKSCSNNKIIEVKTVAVDIENTKYVYIVSVGKIISEGANVEWDLSDVKPGNYTITAGISQLAFDGNGWAVYGQTKTKIVIVKE